MPAMADWSCPPSLNALSITLISVAVVSSPVKAVQSACVGARRSQNSLFCKNACVHARVGGNAPLTMRPAPMTSLPRFTVPACKGR